MMKKILALSIAGVMALTVFVGVDFEAVSAASESEQSDINGGALYSEQIGGGQEIDKEQIDLQQIDEEVIDEKTEEEIAEQQQDEVLAAAAAAKEEEIAAAEGEGTDLEGTELDGIDIAAATVTLPQTSYVYNRSYIRPAVTVKYNEETLYEGYDYTVAYSNNLKVGTAKVTVTGIDRYAGTKEVTFKITRKKLTNFWFNGKGSSACTKTSYYVYNGKKKDVQIFTRKVTKDDYGNETTTYIKLKKGTDYTISFPSGRKSIGKHKAIVNFKGNYSGRVVKVFRILPKNPTNVRLTNRTKTSLTFKWNKVKGAKGYKVKIMRDGGKTSWKTLKGYSKNKLTIKKKYGFEGSVLIKVYAYKKVNGTTYKSKDGTYGNNEYYKPGKAKFTMTRDGFSKVNFTFPKYTYYQVIITRPNGEADVNTRIWNEKGKVWYAYLDSGVRYKVKVREYAYKTDGSLMFGKWTVKYVRPY